ncbi:MAG: AbrB/MazE/SpoVT family DNA-binding domain-containing protein [Nitrososphaerota archaeon]
MAIVKVDGKGRIVIPKSVREKSGLKEGGHARIRTDERGIIIEPLKPIADRYYGAFKIARWPEDLAEFVTEVMRGWWAQKST